MSYDRRNDLLPLIARFAREKTDFGGVKSSKKEGKEAEEEKGAAEQGGAEEGGGVSAVAGYRAAPKLSKKQREQLAGVHQWMCGLSTRSRLAG